MARFHIAHFRSGLVRSILGNINSSRGIRSLRHSDKRQGSRRAGTATVAFLCSKAIGLQWRSIGLGMELHTQNWVISQARRFSTAMQLFVANSCE